jgi:asparagine synthetase B (glutamine-hydrolysing)
LSGGIDSSAIVAMMKHHGNGRPVISRFFETAAAECRGRYTSRRLVRQIYGALEKRKEVCTA